MYTLPQARHADVTDYNDNDNGKGDDDDDDDEDDDDEDDDDKDDDDEDGDDADCGNNDRHVQCRGSSNTTGLHQTEQSPSLEQPVQV